MLRAVYFRPVVRWTHVWVLLSGVMATALQGAGTANLRVWRSGQLQEWVQSQGTGPALQAPRPGVNGRETWSLRPARAPGGGVAGAFFDGRLVLQLAGVVPAALGVGHGQGIAWTPLAGRQGSYQLDCGDPATALQMAVSLSTFPGVLSCEPLLFRQRVRRSLPNDPLLPRQWHLRNRGQLGGIPGIDLNCEPAWATSQGRGVLIGIVDDGVQITHPDLAANEGDVGGWDWNDGDADPSPGDPDIDIHGTQVAGLAAARGDNGIGVCGVAPGSTLVGLRLISAPSTDVTESEAMLFRKDRIAVKNCSWGAPDGTGLLEGVGPLASAALAEAAEQGRGGLGTILVFAAGNGRGVGDNVNYDGYANSPYTIAVGAVSDRGTQTSYGEPGACLVVSAPSGSSGLPRLTTTDIAGVAGADSGDYSTNFTGTSASAPLVSGVVALMLEANPALGWRDVQEILMRSAVRNDATDPGWATNGAGLHFNHKYGAGLADASAAVDMARSWTPLGSRERVAVEWADPGLVIPDNTAAGVSVALPVTARRFRVEHATLRVGLTHDDWGDLQIDLIAPSGMSSRLAEPHSPAFDTDLDWTFLSVRHWGESAGGTWVVRMSDRRFLNLGRLAHLKLELFGTVSLPARPRLMVRQVPGGMEVRFASESGERYALERSEDLDAWAPVVTLGGTGGQLQHIDTEPPGGRRFYRVVVE